MRVSQNITDRIRQIAGEGNVRFHEKMKDHTTMKVGGEAALFVTPETTEAVTELVRLLKKEQIPYYVLGNGSNVICRDEGYGGVILCLAEKYKGFQVLEQDPETAEVTVKAGTDNKDLSDGLTELGLSGFEFASGIPGSMGGATCMNAGAYDGEMRQIIKEVKILDRDGSVVCRSNEEMAFGYRHSLASGGDCVILETVLTLRRDDPEKIRERVEDLTRRRQEKQPLEYPSCGSTFKRPEGYFAGKLISDAGLKGYCIGGAQVSEKHAGFVINKDHATAKDVLDLVEYIKKQVLESQGVQLECEIRIL